MLKKQISEKITRIFERNDSMLTRYNILRDGDAETTIFEGSSVEFKTKNRTLTVSYENVGKGFEIRIPLSKSERIYGGGDSQRETIMHRGNAITMDVRNVVCYSPISFFMSTDGWGILVNCTYKHVFDIDKTEKDTMVITAEEGTLDFYIFTGENFAELLKLYTDISGKPTMLPKYAYGFMMCENDQCNAYTLHQSCKNFRDIDIPCDTISLEPGWMETYYDYSTNKRWDPVKFELPYWYPENTSARRTFFFPMREMGMSLNLWLCEDYDLFYEEEGSLLRSAEATFFENADIVDRNLEKEVRIDKISDEKEPWFEHLKKFVDNGAAGFKLDAATQVLYHPDRLWGGKFLDAEAHNAYCVVLAKQMYNGFREHTDRRPLIFTADCIAGSQQYTSCWSGDTGGGPKTIVALLNYAMSAQPHTSCDMDILDPKGLHYGFLIPFSQLNNWAKWLYPWYFKAERQEVIRFYSKLRSSLFPYIYAAAHNAHNTGYPIMRPLPLVYEDTDRFDNAKNIYMLGDSLLVGVFDMHFDLPDGVWIDYFTGKEYQGTIDYEIPEGKGGVLFAKKGSVIFTMKPQQYLLEKEHDYEIRVYPGADCEAKMIEDDGWSFDYEEGKVATTRASITNTKIDGFEFTLNKREGSFDGKPDNGHDHFDNSIPKVSGMQPVRDITIKIFGQEGMSVEQNGKKIETVYEDGFVTFVVEAELHDAGDVTYEIKY